MSPGLSSAKLNRHLHINSLPPTALSVWLGGLLPFGAIFVEYYFVLSGIWKNEYYYAFTALAPGTFLMLCTSAGISIVLCYFHLQNEDYNWWWRSFLTPASSALYLFLYS